MKSAFAVCLNNTYWRLTLALTIFTIFIIVVVYLFTYDMFCCLQIVVEVL